MLGLSRHCGDTNSLSSAQHVNQRWFTDVWIADRTNHQLSSWIFAHALGFLVKHFQYLISREDSRSIEFYFILSLLLLSLVFFLLFFVFVEFIFQVNLLLELAKHGLKLFLLFLLHISIFIRFLIITGLEAFTIQLFLFFQCWNKDVCNPFLFEVLIPMLN